MEHKLNFSQILLTFFVLLAANYSHAQTRKIDSLTLLIKAHPQEDDRKVILMYDLATQYLYTEPKKTLNQLDQILLFAPKVKDKTKISSTYRLKGISYYLLSDYTNALENLNIALGLDRGLKHDYGIIGALGNIASVYLAQSNLPAALNYYQQSAKIMQTLPNQKLNEMAVKSNIGIIYLQNKEYEKALVSFLETMEVYKKLKFSQGESNSLGNIAIIYSEKKEYEKAIYYSKLSEKICDSIGDKIGQAREIGNLSTYNNKLKRFEISLDYGLKAIELNKAISRTKSSLGYNYQNVAEAYLGKGDYQQALYFSKAALKTGQDLKLIDIQKEAYLGLSEIYEKINKPDSSLIYYKKSIMLKDSIMNDKTKQQLTRMDMRYEFDKTESTYKQRQLLSDEKLKQQQLQLALNYAELQRSQQLRDLQRVQIENEKLIGQEKQKQLLISKNKEKLQLGKVKALSQEQELNRLELNQLWLFGVLAVVILISILIYLLNLQRIRRLRFKNTLQNQEAEQRALLLTHKYQLSESELKSIRSQMNPHFIFNVLNSIESYIMDNDKRTASRLVQKFAALSRLILENSTKSLVTADKEWKALTLYTELEAMRYNDSFKFNFIVDEQLQLNTLLLPPMLIQPLIENAILHGLIKENKSDAYLEVKLELTSSGICITVTDNGLGIGQSKQDWKKVNGVKEKSIGIESIKERIEIINLQQNTNVASFTISPGIKDRGTVAMVCLPEF